MKSKAFLIIPLGLAVAGCVAPDRYDKHTAPTACIQPQPITKDCDNPGNVPKVVLTLANMKTNPPNVCASPGSKFVMQIAPPPKEAGTVSISPKVGADTWLNGTNSPDPKFIEIDVPTWLTPGSNYYYAINTSLGTCVDPRVDIVVDP